MSTLSTADAVLQALESYELKDEGNGKYRSNSPLRPGSNSHAFTLKIDGPEHGAYHDHVTGDTGSLYALAQHFGISVESTTVKAQDTEYNYVDEDGTLLYQAVRYYKNGKKNFFQRRPDGKGGWINNLDGVDRVIYRLPDVIAAKQRGETIYIVEGEKDVETLRMHGLTATCNVGGAKKWRDEYAWNLRGCHVVILPDNDPPGRDHAQQVIKSFLGMTINYLLVNLPDLPEKGDISDWLAMGHTIEELLELVKNPPPDLTTNTTAKNTANTAPTAKRFTVRSESELEQLPPLTWLQESEVIKGGYHLIYGASGSGKTFYAIRRAMLSAAQGLNVLYIATEDLTGLKTRVAAWRRAFPDQHGTNLTWLDMPLGIDLHEHSQVDELLAAITPYHYDHIILDTLREAHTGDENSSQDGAAINRVIQRLIRETGAAIDVVHHSGVESARPRGTTAVFSNADMVLRVSGDGELVTVHCDKLRNSAQFDDRCYALTAATPDTLTPVLRPTEQTTRRGAKLNRIERAVLDALSLSVFAESGAKTRDLLATAEGVTDRTIYRALSHLKDRGFVSQSVKGDPYFITAVGRAQLMPEYVTTPTDTTDTALTNTDMSVTDTPTELTDTDTTLQGVSACQWSQEENGQTVEFARIEPKRVQYSVNRVQELVDAGHSKADAIDIASLEVQAAQAKDTAPVQPQFTLPPSLEAKIQNLIHHERYEAARQERFKLPQKYHQQALDAIERLIAEHIT